VSIQWLDFLLVVGVSLFSACLVVTVFSLALRIGDGEERWRRPVSVGLYVVGALGVLYGIYLIVPALHT
jgi:hypothetical protein